LSNVTPLFGDVPAPGEPDVEIVEKLEELLERAKRGEIEGVGIAIVMPGDVQATWWRGRKWSDIAAAVGCLSHRIFGRDEDS
jgi:predicted NBD/HSP70 family sugar kinase